MKVKELLSVLINSSEKAARIARLCRSNQDLFSLLIEEKTGQDKNERFFQDFKTLADVIIQELIKSDVGMLFPKLKDNIKGEESNKFENTLGEQIYVEIENEEKTFSILMRILDQNESIAKELTNEIHRKVIVEEEFNFSDSDLNQEIDENNISIWIDPIDATQEYISANEQQSPFKNIMTSGLQCATVLIGTYLKSSGEPLLGIINQPFAVRQDNGEYKSKIFYGISLNDLKFSNVIHENNPLSTSEKKLAIISSSEAFKSNLFECCVAAGAGYKALKVIQKHADIYYLSKNSTFKWDTCAAQAILRSFGGDIVELNSSVKLKKSIPLSYKDDEEKCNQNGLIAFIDIEDFNKLVDEMHANF
ncbi:hypothetical protein PVAND_000502 [Polypedilum vanderplanki]|uniref:Inositol polyphosphate 1-phosphatase n=1 Tax=Polypedilum vanderplanki TaxID=319348 RepID=A0A9J6BK09_POLVA|nr:hypothetical protein PVAND_000502 [Polypedilum vanderplanki]